MVDAVDDRAELIAAESRHTCRPQSPPASMSSAADPAQQRLTTAARPQRRRLLGHQLGYGGARSCQVSASLVVTMIGQRGSRCGTRAAGDEERGDRPLEG